MTRLVICTFLIFTLWALFSVVAGAVPTENDIYRIYLEDIRKDVSEANMNTKELGSKFDNFKDYMVTRQAEDRQEIVRLDSNQRIIFRIGAGAISMSFLALLSVVVSWLSGRMNRNSGRVVFKEDIQKWITEEISRRRGPACEDTRN